jgi:hypothetical protein
MVARYPVTAFGSHGNTAKNITAADDDTDLDPEFAGFRDIARNAVSHRNVNAEALIAH